MSYAPYPRGTLLVPSGPKNHLFIIITKKCPTHCHLIINVTSIKEGKFYDPACVFSGGEHHMITQPSYVYYKMAEQKNAHSIADLVSKSYYLTRDDLGDPHFGKVCDGIFQSRFAKPWVKEYFRTNAS